MNSEVGQWLLSRTPFGCLVRTVLILFAVLIIPIWGFDQYLHWRAAQPSQASHPSPPAVAWHGPVFQLELSRPFLAVAVVALVVAVIVFVALLPGTVCPRPAARKPSISGQ